MKLGSLTMTGRANGHVNGKNEKVDSIHVPAIKFIYREAVGLKSSTYT